MILCVPSTHIGMGGMRLLWERNIVDSIEPFQTKNKCKWFVVDRLHGKGVVAEFETEAGFFFHTINAFEERDESDEKAGTTSLFCEVIEYDNYDVMFSLYYDVLLQRKGATERIWGSEAGRKGCIARLARYRFRVPTSGGKSDVRAEAGVDAGKPSCPGQKHPPIEVEKLITIPAPHIGDLPTINPLFSTKRHRYVYSLPNRGLSTLTDTIAKTDIETRETLYWNNPKGHTPGEAIFIPRPGGAEEDDGVLLSVVLDGTNNSSYLLCLDASTMTEVGHAEVGFPVAFGFHGMHNEGRGKL